MPVLGLRSGAKDSWTCGGRMQTKPKWGKVFAFLDMDAPFSIQQGTYSIPPPDSDLLTHRLHCVLVDTALSQTDSKPPMR
eukprot:8491872-Ditylum_brightwellii.AAC.1